MKVTCDEAFADVIKVSDDVVEPSRNPFSSEIGSEAVSVRLIYHSHYN